MKQTGIFAVIYRLVRLLWADLRCEGYLIARGMWRGECKLHGWHKDDGRLSFIATTTGSIFDGTLAVKRVFWNEHDPNIEMNTKVEAYADTTNNGGSGDE
jgi:hypothetical protein